MTASGWLATMRRRWPVLAAALLCTVVAVWLVHKRPIAYQDCASVAVAASPTQMSPNVYSNTQNSLVAATGVVTEQLMSTQVQARLKAAGLTATYTAQVHNTGTSETPAYSEPLTDICTSSYDSAVALRTADALVKDFGTILRARQVAIHVPRKSLATTTVIASPNSQPVTGRPSQAYIGVGLSGVIIAIALTAWSDQYLRRREQRARRRQPGPPPSSRPGGHRARHRSTAT